MARGAVLLTAALTLALATPSAAGQPGSQPDLMIVGRGGSVLTGDDIHNDDGVGQQRSVIVDQRLTVTVRIQNEGAVRGRYRLNVAVPDAADGFRVLRGSAAVTIGARRSSDHQIVIAHEDAPFGATHEVLITVTSKSDPTNVDAVRMTITNVSTPE